MEDHVRELMSRLPYSVQDKLRHYLAYVNDALIDIALEEGVYERLGEVRAEVQLVFALRFLYGYFVVGFRNLERTLEYFESMKIDGFQIGTTAFTRREPITAQWREIAAELEQLISEAGIAPFMTPTVSVKATILELIRPLLRSTEIGRSD